MRLGAGIGGAFAKDDERGSGSAEEGRGLGDECRGGGGFGWWSNWRAADGKVRVSRGGIEDEVCGQVDEGGTRTAIPAYSVGVADGVYDGRRVIGGWADSKFGVGCKEGDGVHFLEGAFGREICFRRAGKEESGKGIGGGVSYLAEVLVGRRAVRGVVHTPAMPWRTPGPPTSRQTPGFPVM